MLTSGRTVYLDSSAIVKLVVTEAESDSLRRFLTDCPNLVTSILARVEVIRAVRPSNPSAVAVAQKVLDGMQILELTGAVAGLAAEINPSLLRTLDAIHVASALYLGSSLDVLVSYDRRILAAARAAGVRTASPS